MASPAPVVGRAAGGRVRLAVIARLPDGQAGPELLDVAADASAAAALSLGSLLRSFMAVPPWHAGPWLGRHTVRAQPTTTNVSQRHSMPGQEGAGAGPQAARDPPQVLVLAIGRRLPHPVPTVLGGSGTSPVATEISALIAGCPNPGIGVFSTWICGSRITASSGWFGRTRASPEARSR